MGFSHLVVIWTFLVIARRVTADCYHLNGTTTTEPFHGPCSSDSSDPLSFVCCANLRPNPFAGNSSNGNTADKCLPNGICQNVFQAQGSTFTTFWREECTERDWKSGTCPDFCIEGSDGNGNVRMTPCDGTPTSERWCCGDSNSCCGASNDFNVVIVPARFGESTTASASSSSTSATSSPTSSSASASVSTSTSTPALSSSTNSGPTSASSGLSTGAKAGIGIGVSLGALAIFGAGFLVARRRGHWRHTKIELPGNELVTYRHDAKQAYREEAETDHLGRPAVKSVMPHRQELGGVTLTAEAMDTRTQDPQELP